MNTPVYIAATNIYSPIGKTTSSNFNALLDGKQGVQLQTDKQLSEEAFYASLFTSPEIISGFSKFESILISSLRDAMGKTEIKANDPRTILILSTTKGNISRIETGEPYSPAEISLSQSAEKIKNEFGFTNQPLIVSNACISGILAMIVGKRLIQSGMYDHAVIAGADLITKFILSGFQSFQAISPGPCKPFDAARNGINLGEAAGTIILTKNESLSAGVCIAGGASSNDANHISGPSRTGAELADAINRSLKEAGLLAEEIDFISAHGTATVYNDEMEAKAFHLSAVDHAPLNSLKGFYGHTLGAAGIIESAVAVQSLLNNKMIATPGYEMPGTTIPVEVIRNVREQSLNTCLKTGSGFGGCNAAVIFKKVKTNN